MNEYVGFNDFNRIVQKQQIWHNIYINIAKEISKFSTCCKLKVGAVLVKDNFPVSIGYNGVPSKILHCSDYFMHIYKQNYKNIFKTIDEYFCSEDFKKQHSEWTTFNEIHAEINCLLQAAKRGISTKDCILYITHAPCINCSTAIVSSGVTSIYVNDLRKEKKDNGIDFLKRNKITVTYCD